MTGTEVMQEEAGNERRRQCGVVRDGSLAGTAEEKTAVTFDGRSDPLLGNELPKTERTGTDSATAPDVVHEIVAEVMRRDVKDACGKLLTRNAGTDGEQLASPIGSIGVDGHTVVSLRVERTTVCHRQDMNLFTLRTSHVDRVADTGRRVEVEGKVLETQPTPGSIDGCEEHDVVSRRMHLVRPEGVGIFQIILHLAPGETHGVEHVLIAVEIEHVAHVDVSGTDDSIIRQRSAEGDVCPGDVKLETMDEIDESRRAEIGRLCAQRLGHRAYALGNVVLHRVISRTETLHEIVTDTVIPRTHEPGRHPLAHDTVSQLGEAYVDVAHHDAVVGRIDNPHGLPFDIGHRAAEAAMVMPDEDDVETGNIVRDVHRRILIVEIHLAHGFLTGMEHTDENVGPLLFAYEGYPSRSAFLHILETQATPKRLRKPHGNGGRNHAENGNAHAGTLKHDIGLEIRLSGACVDDIGPEDRKIALAYPAVVDLVPALDVMIAEVAHIATEIVEHGGRNMFRLCVDKVIIIGRGLSLKDVSIVDINKPFAPLRPHLLQQRADTGQATLGRLVGDEIVGEKVSVDVARLDELQMYFLCLQGRNVF